MENITATNFIEEIINKDLESGKVKKVITRFPPEPNGYLHIGHAKSIFLNHGIARKYNGQFNLRFDDSNPAKEDVEYINAIYNDLDYLGIKYDEVHYASDYYDKCYEFAIKLIKEGKAYVCDLNADEIRESRGTLTEKGTNSPYRDRSIEENLDLFERMRNGEFNDGERVLRAKIDMASPNINMRDPVLYRILHKTHHRTGDKWCIYAMYDFIHPISDALEGITHSICTLEFEDHRPLYDWVTENCGFINPPRQIEFAKLYLSETIVGKRYLKQIVDSHQVEGWFDPRMPTLSGMKRRGYPSEALKDFCNRIGVAKTNSKVDLKFLQYCVRENLNENAERAMVVLDPIKVTITNYDKAQEKLLVPLNPMKEDEIKEISFSNEIYIERDDFMVTPPPKYKRLVPGGYVRLKGAYIIKCNDYVLNEDGSVKEVIAEYVPNSKSGQDESGIKVKGVIHFVDAKNSIDVTANNFENLFVEGEDGLLKVNEDSKHVFSNAKAEKYLLDAKEGSRYQFLRKGYYSLAENENGKLSFNEIVSLKDSYKIV